MPSGERPNEGRTSTMAKLIWSIWWLILSNVIAVTGATDSVAFDYDGQIQSKIVYDGSPNLSRDYDGALMFTSGEKQDCPVATRHLFDKFAGFFAVKGVAPRALTQADLGVKGMLQELKGTFAVKDGVAQVRVDMIRGDIQNPFQIIKNLSETAKAQGASTLRIEATLANEKLYNVLVRRYGLVTEGSKDIITIPIK